MVEYFTAFRATLEEYPPYQELQQALVDVKVNETQYSFGRVGQRRGTIICGFVPVESTQELVNILDNHKRRTINLFLKSHKRSRNDPTKIIRA